MRLALIVGAVVMAAAVLVGVLGHLIDKNAGRAEGNGA
jgi:hypothetical protein